MAKSYALTTTARVKTYLNISVTTHDTLLERLIDQVTEFIENYTGRRFKLTTYTSKEYDGTGTNKLILEDYPIVSFSALQERGTRQNESSWNTISSEDYFVDNPTGIITAVPFEFVKGTKLYRATYTAGYDFDNSATFLGDTEAGDIEWVAWELIKASFDKRKQEGGVSQVRLGDASVTYRGSVMNDPELKNILDSYKRVVI